MSSYAASSDSGGLGFVGWLIIIVLSGMILGAVIPQNVIQDFLSGKTSSLNEDNDGQKCKNCKQTTFDVVDGYCANCRLILHKEHKNVQ